MSSDCAVFIVWRILKYRVVVIKACDYHELSYCCVLFPRLVTCQHNEHQHRCKYDAVEESNIRSDSLKCFDPYCKPLLTENKI